ncbi:hypothetical protein Tco_0675972 [Tanacetum coccineum]
MRALVNPNLCLRARLKPRHVLKGHLGTKTQGETYHPLIWNQYVVDPSRTGTKYQHEEAAVSYADLKASIDQYYDENIAHRDQTDKLVEASMSSLDRSSTTIGDLYKGLNVITELLKNVNTAVKDDPATNQKINEATKTFARISSNITETLSLVKGKSSTNMTWNLGFRMSGVELSQAALKREISSLRKDNFKIKFIMTEMYATFHGQPSSAPSGGVTLTLALTDIQANVEGENANTTTTEEPPSHTEGKTEEPKLDIPISSIPSTTNPPTQAQPITSIIIHPESSQATPKIDKGKGIETESDDDPSKKLVKASSIVRLGLDEPVRVEFMINGKIVYLTEQEIQDYWDKEEQIKKVEEEARLFAMTKPEVIKVVQEEAEKIRLDPKAIKGAKAGEMFKKAQDAEHVVFKRQHTKKVRKSLELRKHKYDSYMWTVSSRLKPEPITDIKIHPKTKLVVITVYKGTDVRNFEGPLTAAVIPILRRKQKPWNLSLKQESLDWNAIELSLKMSRSSITWSLKEPEYEVFITDEFRDQDIFKMD